ncbi:single-stranded DNA-binding protein [Flexivirga oryzae]|uniref:Single-stranded DNA-binding protein n=1 Tax=Flexivirga oryzae TaxID=1794944 RepID=A0A839N369_9MICO|nr:single-stranded DNA-binding protein [Flexivirga oryzae]MBB2890393.1 single-strand DNA-binding protein [Flexivirga oryzae]
MSQTSLTIRGNLTAKPERITGSKGDFTTFRVAVNESYFDQAVGGYVDGRTSFFRVVAFRQLGTNVYKSLSKGDAVVVTGKLRINQWESAAGDTRSAPEIEAYGVGPDLRFGIATYQRIPSQRQQQASWRNQTAEAPADPWGGEQDGTPDGSGDSGFVPREDGESAPIPSSGPLLEQTG